jgi:hypothetical protein
MAVSVSILKSVSDSRRYLSIYAKDASTDERTQDGLEKLPFLILPELGLEDVRQHARVPYVDHSGEPQDGDGIHFAKLFVEL